MIRYFARLMLLCVAVALTSAALGAERHFRVPLFETAPTLDGKLAEGEWDRSAGFDGMAWRGFVEERQVRYRVGATETALYVAIESELPAEGKLLGKATEANEKLVHDDSFEVWIDPTPGTDRGITYQLLGGVSGPLVFLQHLRGGGKLPEGWKGEYELKHGFTETHWITEIRIPSKVFGGRKMTDGRYSVNVCRNWKQPWCFSSLDGNVYRNATTIFTFGTDDVLAVQYRNRKNIVDRDIDGLLEVTNPTDKPIAVTASIALDRSDMPTMRASKPLELAPGESGSVELAGEAKVSKFLTLNTSVVSADGKTTYYKQSYKVRENRPVRWETTKAVLLPVDFKFAHFPYRQKLRIMSDATGLAEGSRLDRLVFTVRKKGSTAVVKSIEFKDMTGPRHEATVGIGALDGEYEISMQAFGKDVPEKPLVKTFTRATYPWENNTLGRSTKVYPPFTPIRFAGKELSTVLRQHTLNDLGLLDQVVAADKPLLDGGITFKVKTDGADRPLKIEPLKVVEAKSHVVKTQSTFSAGALRATAEAEWDYDGTVKYQLTLAPTGGKTVNELTLDIPLNPEQATMLHGMRDGIRNTTYIFLPKDKQGVLWSGADAKGYDLPNNFCSYVFIGNGQRGFSWFADNDKNWSWDRETPSLEVLREGGRIVLRVYLVNKPVVIDTPRTLTFGMLAAPAKPRLAGWRHKWTTERYTLLGTDINWLSLGTCGEVYPLNQDMYYWEAIQRGNTGNITREYLQEVIDRGMPTMEKVGPAKVETWVRHVRHNVGGGRLNKTMVFYYNRAMSKSNFEYPTFMNEWSLDDYPSHDFNPKPGEVKLVPSESYCDFALYWYKKSFEYGNKGVYWDNWYLRPSYNREMTDAYTDASGTIVPAAGMWGLRELSRRTFVMMNELGMLPITMPHMTSTNVLPMHSFATVQYDWEWKYSTGDVQYRFPRAYLILVSTGELAGAWPVLLHDHGKQATDEWTQRTFAGVALVHELVGNGRGQVWKTLRDPMLETMQHKDVVAFRYWDEKPQPVTTGQWELPGIVLSLPGKHADYVLCSYAEKDMPATVTIDPTALGFKDGYKVINIETKKPVEVENNTIKLTVKKHEVIGLRLIAAARAEK